MAAVSGPRSISRTESPCRRASAPMAMPVGPAPTTIRSMISFRSRISFIVFVLSRALGGCGGPLEEVVHGTVPAPLPYRIRGGDGARQIGDGALDGPRQLLASAETGGNGRREGAAGAVRRGGVEPGMGEAVDPSPCQQQIDH